jgi:8-oxo-dGTP pyrophosphatase MutT (NUDIX family)
VLFRSPEEALVREAREETGFSVTIERRLGEIHWVFEHGDRRIEFRSHVFLLAEASDEPVVLDPDERITGFKEVSICELGDIAEQLRNLTGRWHDWGVFRAIPHEMVYDTLCPPR